MAPPAEFDHLEEAIATGIGFEWYVVCGIVVGLVASVAFLVGLTACAYRCYQQHSAPDVNKRLSNAIRKGLNESGSLNKSPSLRSTSSVEKSGSKNSINGRDGGSGDATLQSGGQHGTPGAHRIALDMTKIKIDLTRESVVKRSPTEKADAQKEQSEDELKINKLGNIQFNIEYDPQKTSLIVTIIRASDLPAKDANIGSSDPYIKLQLLPEKRHKSKTRVLRKTLNPVYDETFTFYGIDCNQLQGVTLHFVVLSFDRFSRDDIIGEVIHPLLGMDHIDKQPINITKPISPRHIKIHSQGRGELLVSLCYQPAANRLTVVILKARNLPKMDITGLSDPYVKIYLLYNGQRIAKKKTHVKKRTLNPVFNESFLFDVPCNEGLSNISIEFMILDWDRMTKNEVVGRLEIGSKFEGQEAHHWAEVINCPRKQIAEWHKLKE